jgi:transcriptional regulator with XRE-family HTH domain
MVKGTTRKATRSGEALQLKKLRESLSLSQQALSNLLGVSLQTVWRWENQEFEFNPKLLKLIPILNSETIPDWCDSTKKSRADVTTLLSHVKGCEQCQMVLFYLDLKTK